MKWNFLYQITAASRLGGYCPPDPRSLCPLSSTEFVEPPPWKKFLGMPLLLSLPFSPFKYWSSLLSLSSICATVQWQILVRYRKDPVYVYRHMLCNIKIQTESSLWLCHIAMWCSEDSFMILLIYLWVKTLLYSSNTTVDMSQNGIDMLVKTKISSSHRETNPSQAVNNHSLQ